MCSLPVGPIAKTIIDNADRTGWEESRQSGCKNRFSDAIDQFFRGEYRIGPCTRACVEWFRGSIKGPITGKICAFGSVASRLMSCNINELRDVAEMAWKRSSVRSRSGPPIISTAYGFASVYSPKFSPSMPSAVRALPPDHDSERSNLPWHSESLTPSVSLQPAGSPASYRCIVASIAM